jgi:hypothetical protein
MNQLGTTQADGLGAWSLSTEVLPEGDHFITATQLRCGGNAGAVSAALGRHGRYKPSLCDALDRKEQRYGALVPFGGLTKDPSPSLSRHGRAGSTVEVTLRRTGSADIVLIRA